jgi:hypothetical protein
MQKKISTLEEENKMLRTEVHHIVQHSDEIEENERKLIEDLSSQLNSKTADFDNLTQELERYKDENRLQYDEIISLTRRLSEAEMRLHQITHGYEETSSLLCITKENQDMLAHELTEFKSRYAETLALLHETQDHLRKHLKKSQPSVRSSLIPVANPYFANDSLQSELMDSLDSKNLQKCQRHDEVRSEFRKRKVTDRRHVADWINGDEQRFIATANVEHYLKRWRSILQHNIWSTNENGKNCTRRTR